MELESKLEKRLYDAAVENDVRTLRELLQQDPLILDKPTSNFQGMNPLHIAAMFGSVGFVKEVLGIGPDLCLEGDRFGRIPLHLAVIKGRLPVLQELISARPLAARVKTEGGGNVLHLCVKYNQLEALKFFVRAIRDKDFANREDDDGMTVLHLAICDKQTETLRFLLHENRVKVNAKNASGRTALDLCEGNSNSEMAQILESAGAKRGKDMESSEAQGKEWLSRKRDALMVVASLIATMAFQVGVNPPGGVWQDDKSDGTNPHVAGTAVMGYKHPNYYKNFIRVNTVAFVSSLSTILFLISGLPFRKKLFLWALMVIMWLTVTAIALTYGISIVMITPRQNVKQLSQVIRTGVSVWCGVMSLLLLGNTIRLINRWLRRHYSIDPLNKLRGLRHSPIQAQSKSKLGSLQIC